MASEFLRFYGVAVESLKQKWLLISYGTHTQEPGKVTKTDVLFYRSSTLYHIDLCFKLQHLVPSWACKSLK